MRYSTSLATYTPGSASGPAPTSRARVLSQVLRYRAQHGLGPHLADPIVSPAANPGPDPNLAFSRPISSYSGVTTSPSSAAIASQLVTNIASSGFSFGMNLGQDGNGSSVIFTTSSVAKQSVTWTGSGASKTFISGTTNNATTGTVGSNGVSIPIGALKGGTSDQPLYVYYTDTDELIELWVATPFNSSNVAQTACVSGGHWTADYGGYCANFSTSWGLFPCNPPTSGAPTINNGYGVNAAGTCATALMITQADVKSGVIAHTISFAGWSSGLNGRVAPAIRSDSGSSTNGIAEGQWITWAPGTTKPSGRPPICDMIFNAIRDYGMVCVDQSGDYTFQTELAQVNGTNGADATDYISAATSGVAEYNLFNQGNWLNSFWGNVRVLTPPASWPTSF